MPRGVRGSANKTRASETHDMHPVHHQEDTPWLRGSSLDMPPARPGMDQRWIRVSMGGKDDQTNWARKQREGWKARKADTVSEDFPVPRIEQGKHAGYIGVEGMILCERPLSISESRTRHFRGETYRRTEAINADLQRTNAEIPANPAFGKIRMAIGERKVMREVNVAEDTE